MKTREVELFIDDELINLVVDEHDQIIAPEEYKEDSLIDLIQYEHDYAIEIGSVEWLEGIRKARKLKAAAQTAAWNDLVPENGHLKKDGYIGGADERN